MLSLADVDQRADDVAHHVVQEGIRADGDCDAAPAAFNIEKVHRPHGAFGLALARPERAEVMLADKIPRRVAHRTDVERRVHPAHMACLQGGTHRAIDQQVAIGARTRRIARMEILRHVLRPEHRHRVRQQSIHAAHPRGIRPVGRSVEMHHLAPGVHAAVSPACAGHANLHAGDCRQCGFECVLHGSASRLCLPAEKAAAVIFDAERDSVHVGKNCPENKKATARGRGLCGATDRSTELG